MGKSDSGKKTYKVEWEYDPEEKSEVPVTFIKQPNELAIVVGEVYNCKYEDKSGDRWFPAKVLSEVKSDSSEKMYKVEWEYDPTEKSEVPAANLKKLESKSGGSGGSGGSEKTLGIFGNKTSRQEAAAKVQDLVDGKELWPQPEWSGG